MNIYLFKRDINFILVININVISLNKTETKLDLDCSKKQL